MAGLTSPLRRPRARFPAIKTVPGEEGNPFCPPSFSLLPSRRSRPSLLTVPTRVSPYRHSRSTYYHPRRPLSHPCPPFSSSCWKPPPSSPRARVPTRHRRGLLLPSSHPLPLAGTPPALTPAVLLPSTSGLLGPAPAALPNHIRLRLRLRLLPAHRPSSSPSTSTLMPGRPGRPHRSSSAVLPGPPRRHPALGPRSCRPPGRHRHRALLLLLLILGMPLEGRLPPPPPPPPPPPSPKRLPRPRAAAARPSPRGWS